MTKIVEDLFTEGSDTNLIDHTPDTGTGWTEEEQTGAPIWEVVGGGGYAHPSGLGNSNRTIYSAQPDPSVTEYDLGMLFSDVARSDDAVCALVARFTDTDNYYSAGAFATGFDSLQIYKKVAGVITQLATGGQSPGALDGDEQYIFRVRDSTDRQTLRNDTDAEEITADDTALTVAGKVGIGSGSIWITTHDQNPDWHVDEFYWDDLAVEGGPVAFPLPVHDFGVVAVPRGGRAY